MQNNWQQQQQPYGGYGQSFNQQQPQQTGAGTGGFGGMGMGNQSFMQSQPTGFGMQQQRPMQTGMGMGMGMGYGGQPQQPQQPQQSQMTGASGASSGNYSFLNQPPSTQHSSFRSNFTGSSGLAPQMTGFPGGGASGLLPQQTGYSVGGLMSQPTGMGMRPQPTGFHDPRLQTMMQSFMPSNTSQPFAASGAPQFNQTAQPLQQQFQSLLQNPSVRTPKVPWTLTKQEKKDYDQIFRAWDTDGDGFITGETAIEVFGQSGLAQDGLMKIWTLSDVDNRGKLNLPEFHVAMGLIYRALNGNEIPDRLPEELVPASMRDIDTTVSFMRDLLKHESTNRSNTASPSYGSSSPMPASKDATNYKHDDSTPAGYKPSSRHLDRKSVRYAGEDSGADIDDIRRQLANTSAMLDKSNQDYERKSEEDEQLEEEMGDLKRKVKRIQDDIEYVSKGRRTTEKDEERRKLERELLQLMHEKLPELERRQKQREDEKRMDERAGIRARDRRNESNGRYGRDDDKDWLRGSYDRPRDSDRDSDRDYYRRDERYGGSRDRSRERSRERYDRDRPRSPPRTRSPPPAPPAVPSITDSAPPAPPAPTSKAAAAPSTKNMTPEERSAYIREQAQRRIQERLRALGVESAPVESGSPVDKSVEERLEREKKEAADKAKSSEQEQQAREEARRARLQGKTGESQQKEGTDKPASSAPEAPAPPKSAMKKPAAAPPAAPPPRSKAAPVPPKPRVPPSSSPAAPPPAAVKQEDEDPEEVELRKKEEARQKSAADRRARLAALEAEEEEERKREEEIIAARKQKFVAAIAEPDQAVTSPPAPPAPPAPPVSNSASRGAGHNPFRKPGAGAPAAGAAGGASNGGFNPFFRPPAASPSTPSSAPRSTQTPSAPVPPPAPPTPAMPSRAVAAAADDEWEKIEEKGHDLDFDSSDDDYATSRTKRAGLASALFGNILPSSASPTTSRPPSAPLAPKAPANAGALATLGGGSPTTGGGGGMSALLAGIQGGARLKKAQTVDKSRPPVSGKVIGGVDAPAHINTGEPAASTGRGVHDDYESQEREEDQYRAPNPNRQSTDWYASLAADQASSHASHAAESRPRLETMAEEIGGYEPISDAGKTHGESGEEGLEEFDLGTTIRVRTLYPYEGQRDVDLSFADNLVLLAHPAKDSDSSWWYGLSVKEGKKGWFPHNYVEEIRAVKAKANFSYDGSSDEELPFVEGDILDIVDTSDNDWWKTEKAGAIFIVPASYFDLMG